MTDAQLLQLVIDNIKSGNRNTKASMLRTVLDQFIADKQNEDGKDAANGYPGLDSNLRMNPAYLGQASPLDKVLRDDGTFVYQNIRSLFQSFSNRGNTGTLETNLVDNTVAANTVAVDGDSLHADYAGTMLLHATATRRLRAYFGGAPIFDSTPLTLAANESYKVSVDIIRASSATARYVVTLLHGTSILLSTGEVPGLDYTSPLHLILTGTAAGAGAATDDIVNIMSNLSILKA